MTTTYKMDKIDEKVAAVEKAVNTDDTKSVKIVNPEKVDVPYDLLMSIRSVFDVVNSRVHWRTNELLPMGIIIKQLDEIIGPVPESGK